MTRNPEYIGDGVYMEMLPDGSVCLRANDHHPDHCTDTVILEPSVLESLVQQVKAFDKLTPEQQRILVTNPQR